MSLRVLIVDDESLARARLRTLIGDCGESVAYVAGEAANAVQAILNGGFAPATAGHPQPYGMPPYRTILNSEEVAAVASFIRQSWGNQGGAVSLLDVQKVK